MEQGLVEREPGAPPAPYSGTRDLLSTTDANPNDVWKLYIYDRYNSAHGHLEGSWQLNFYFR